METKDLYPTLPVQALEGKGRKQGMGEELGWSSPTQEYNYWFPDKNETFIVPPFRHSVKGRLANSGRKMQPKCNHIFTRQV